MAEPIRVRGALLDVLELFLLAFQEKRPLYGWEIKKTTRVSGASTYRILDRLEDAGWVSGHWEDAGAQVPGKPPRRYYDLTGAGEVAARELLAERRPDALRRSVPVFPEPLQGGA
jgi:PadR family transcriptional regulator, regulatory protein PadR